MYVSLLLAELFAEGLRWNSCNLFSGKSAKPAQNVKLSLNTLNIVRRRFRRARDSRERIVLKNCTSFLILCNDDV